MASLDTLDPPSSRPFGARVLSVMQEVVIITVRACVGTLLGLCTFMLLGAYGLVIFTGLSFGSAITVIALALNGILLTSIAIGAIDRGGDEPEVEE